MKRGPNRRNRKNDIWYNLDNVANIYPAVSNDRNTNVFRIACDLKDMVDEAALQQALDIAIQSFGRFQVILRRGLFWFYLERTDQRPIVRPETQRPCERLFHITRKELLFSVTYYRQRINLEVFHAVADGTGAFQLMHAILYQYFLLVYPDRLPNPPPPLEIPTSPVMQAEDSFLHHYDPSFKRMPRQQRAYTISGTPLPGNSIRVIRGDIPTRQMLALAREKGVSLTAYLAALLLCAVYTELMPTRAKKKPLGVTIPVDLRKHFPSETTCNFFGVVDLRYNFEGAPVDFDAVLQAVSDQLEEKLQPEALAGRMNYTMGVQKNLFARVVPLPIKNFVLRFAYNRGERATTCALSNLGRIAMPPSFEQFVDSFSCLLNPTPIHRLKACMCSFGDRLVINLTSCIAETKAQRYFFRHLAAQGLDVCITSNGVDDHEIL